MDIIFAIFGFIFALVGLYFVGQAVLGIVRAVKSRNWYTVDGVITASDVKVDVGSGSSSQASYTPAIEYEYEVRGTRYTADNVNFSRFQTPSPTAAARTVRKYPVGEQVTVYHHPWQPEKATLEPGKIGAQMSGLIVGTAVSAFGLAFGFGGLLGFDNAIDRVSEGIGFDHNFAWTYLVPFIMVIGLLVMAFGFRTIYRSRKTKSWPTTQGIVIGSGIVRSSSSSTSGSSTVRSNYTYKAEIAFEYEVNGQRYVSNRVRLLDIATNNQGRAESIQSRYKEGTPVLVYYDSTNPEQALLEPGGSSGAWLPILVGSGFVIICSIMMWFHSIVAE